ncbi:MAG: transcriptional regulator [Pseudomonadota bacterium]
METHKAKKITIVAEKLIQDQIQEILRKAGATGFSIFEGSGEGSRGVHRQSIVSDFSIVKIETVIVDPAIVDAIAEQVSAAYFTNYSCIVYFDDVEVLRAERF